jgi:hypothetical protein
MGVKGDCTILVGKPNVKRPVGRSRRRRVDNIKIDIGERVDWCRSICDLLVRVLGYRPRGLEFDFKSYQSS